MTNDQKEKVVKVGQLETFAEIIDTLYGTPMGASGENHAPGQVPDPGETTGTSKFLREDGTWNEPTKAQLGLDNVDNTADADKNVNYANSAGDASTVGGYGIQVVTSMPASPDANTIYIVK